MIKVFCEHTEIVNPSKLKPHPKNANIHPAEQIELLARSISEFGWRHPVVISLRSGFIIAGHARRLAAIDLGCDCPVDYQKFKNEAEERAVLIADNLIPELANIDPFILAENKDFLIDNDISLDTVGINVLDDVSDAEPKIDDAEQLNDKWDVKTGQVWQLGKHRLMCGDSAKIGDVKKLINGCEIDMVFTDPMYNDSVLPIINIFQKIDVEHFLIMSTFRQCIDYLTKSNFRFRFDLVFDQKRPSSMLNPKLPYYLHKNIIYFTKCKNTIFSTKNAKGEFSEKNYYPSIIDGPKINNGMHGLSKNVKGIRAVLSGFKANSILDLFAGSGSTLIVCEQTKRINFSMEIIGKYCAVILQRFEDATGNVPKLIN